MTGLDTEDITLMLRWPEVIKSFVDISNNCLTKIREKFSQKLTEKFQRANSFIEFRIDSILKTLHDDLSEICTGIHTSYGRRLWKYCLETLVFEYIQFVVSTCMADPKISLTAVKDKCSAEIKKIAQAFSEKVPERSLDKDSPLISFGKIFYMETLDMESLLRKLSAIKTLVNENH
jgi:hypothetical protein